MLEPLEHVKRHLCAANALPVFHAAYYSNCCVLVLQRTPKAGEFYIGFSSSNIRRRNLECVVWMVRTPSTDGRIAGKSFGVQADHTNRMIGQTLLIDACFEMIQTDSTGTTNTMCEDLLGTLMRAYNTTLRKERNRF